MLTGCPGVFADGDMVPAARTVTARTGRGKKAARCIDACLLGARYAAPPKHERADSGLLHPWYFSDGLATHLPERSVASRITDFSEVTGAVIKLASSAEEEARPGRTTYEEMAARGPERFPAADGST